MRTANKNNNSQYVLPAGSTVLVTGATGFTGLHLIKKLARQNVRVRAIVRSESRARLLEQHGVECYLGELIEQNVVDDATQDVNYIIHMASPYRVAHASNDHHYEIHVTATRMLAIAASRQPDFRRFVHVSTIGVHGHIEDPPATETYRFAPGDSYQATKLQGENCIRCIGETNGLPYVIVRPAAIYGPGDLRLRKLFRMGASRFVPIVGSGRGLYHLVHVRDLTAFLVLAATHPSAVGEDFICASREPIPVVEIIRQAGEVYKVKNYFIKIPASPVMSAAKLCEWLCRPFGISPPLYPRRVAFFTNDRAFDASKMTRLLGFEPSVGNSEGIAEAALSFSDASPASSKEGSEV